MNEMTVFWIGLFGAILGSLIGGYLNYRAGARTAHKIALAKTTKAREKIVHQLQYTLNAIQMSDFDKEVSDDTLISIIVAELSDDEEEKAIRFFQRWKDIYTDVRKSHSSNRAMAVNLTKQAMEPLFHDIEMIIQKYQV